MQKTNGVRAAYDAFHVQVYTTCLGELHTIFNTLKEVHPWP